MPNAKWLLSLARRGDRDHVANAARRLARVDAADDVEEGCRLTRRCAGRRWPAQSRSTAPCQNGAVHRKMQVSLRAPETRRGERLMRVRNRKELGCRVQANARSRHQARTRACANSGLGARTDEKACTASGSTSRPDSLHTKQRRSRAASSCAAGRRRRRHQRRGRGRRCHRSENLSLAKHLGKMRASCMVMHGDQRRLRKI